MVPPVIQHSLAALRRRERLLTLVWGAACWLAIVLVLLLLCGLVDWLIDRQRETPIGVRRGLFVVQALVAGIAGLLFVLWPQVRRLPDTMMALWVEEKIPQFDHRLISAVQFNQPGAQTEGMSKELIAVVTHEAEKQAQGIGGFTHVADHRRLKWTACVLTPIVLVAAIPFAIWPTVCFALLARQALLEVDVPHSVALESASNEYWPIGETITILYRVTGNYSKDMIGSVHVQPEGQATDSYDLKFLTEDADGAIFSAEVHPSSVDLLYWARLEDGRTRYPSEMRLVARPIITENLAWVQLPAYCGLRPAQPGLSVEERRYEEIQKHADVVGIPRSTVRVKSEVQKFIKSAWIELIASEDPDTNSPQDALPAKTKEHAPINMAVKKEFKRLRSDNTGKPQSERRVAAKVTATPADAAGKQTIRVLLEIDEGWRIYANPADREALVDGQTTLTFSVHGKSVPFDVQYAPGEQGMDPDQRCKIYQGEVAITATIQRDPGDTSPLEMGLALQAFTKEERLLPATLRFVEVYVAEGTFPLGEHLKGYRVHVKDEFGFENVPAPRRSLRLIPEDPPQITLLRDTFGPGADYDIEGMPIRLGFKIRVPYVCYGTYGLGRAEILYRILKKQESGNEPIDEDRWVRQPLPELQPDHTAGPFDLKTGVFKNTPFNVSVPFHAVPSINARVKLGRTVGGGRAFLDTKGLIDSSRAGRPLELKEGDQVEYCIKVYAADRKPEELTPFVTSETRVSTVVGEDDFTAWLKGLGEQAKRIKALEEKQKGVRPGL